MSFPECFSTDFGQSQAFVLSEKDRSEKDTWLQETLFILKNASFFRTEAGDVFQVPSSDSTKEEGSMQSLHYEIIGDMKWMLES